MSLELLSAVVASAGSYWRMVAQGGTFEAVGGAEVRAAPVPQIPAHLREPLSGYVTAMARAQDARDMVSILLRRQKSGLMQKLLTTEWRVPVRGDSFVPGGPAADRLSEAVE